MTLVDLLITLEDVLTGLRYPLWFIAGLLLVVIYYLHGIKNRL